MSQSVLKWGNSLAVRIPSAMAKQLGVAEGVEVDVRVEGTRLVVEKADALPEFDHEDLVRSLKKARRDLVDYGSPRGGEEL